MAAACSSGEVATTTSLSEATTPQSTDVPVTPTTTPAGWIFLGVDGVESTIDDTSRIITLSGDLTETVFELGFGGSVVATDVTTVYPSEAVGLPIVGVGRFLTAEGVLGENPTLVIGDTQTSPLETIEQIRSAGDKMAQKPALYPNKFFPKKRNIQKMKYFTSVQFSKHC